VYESFIQSLLGEDAKIGVNYIAELNSYNVSHAGLSDVANTNTYGIADMPAINIISALLNNKEIKVGYRDDEGKFHLNKEKTDEALEKAMAIRDKFGDWLMSDSDRADRMTREYNDKMNNYVVRKFDGAMLSFAGKVADTIIKFRRHQRNAIARIIQDGRALLDHVVGAGKTFTVIGAAMELKRTGLAKKSMIVVPNHLVKQWATDFYKLYPGANILTASKKDFERANRRKFLAKIATGDWDAVIIAHSSFGFIKPEPEFETRFNMQRIEEIMDAIKEMGPTKGADSQTKRTVKQLAKMKERLEQRIKSLRDKPMDDLLDFGQLGIDMLFVDEAHLFKNLMFTTKMQGVRGLGQPEGSMRAYDMFIKTRQVTEHNGGTRGVVFATGTPVSNSLAEMYHMLRYLAPEALEDMGHKTFDAWANTFAEVEQVWMQAMSGEGYKSTNRMTKFVNTPDLLKAYDQVADTVTIEDIKTAYREENNGAEFPIPKLKGGRRTPVSLVRTEAQTAYMEEIAQRAKALEQRKGKPEKGEDNMLSILGDARKAAMDIRLVNPDIIEREPQGRIAVVADNVWNTYQQYNKVRGTQLIFSDMGTPKKHAAKELEEYNELVARMAPLSDEELQADADLGDESAMSKIEDAEAAQRELEAKGRDWLDAIKAAQRGFSVYDDMKAALIEKGIPEDQIAFIHDYNTDDQKAALFRAVNDGKIRVLLGSTPKMGAGTNVQERLVELHHMDVPWKPSDIEQREGRIVRQGNVLNDPAHPDHIPGFEVSVKAYATQDTLDLFMWQTQEKKLAMINQLRTGNVGREMEDAFEELQMSAGEMQAAATSNPYLLEEIQLKDRVKKLERQRKSFEGQQNDLINRKKRAEKDVSELPGAIEKLEVLAKATEAYEKSLVERPFEITINGEKITSEADAGAKLRELTGGDEDAEDKAQMTLEEGAKPKRKKMEPITINGTEYKSKTAVAEAFRKAAGDADKITFERNGEQFIRRADIRAAIKDDVLRAAETDDTVTIGRLGDYEFTVEGAHDKKGRVEAYVNAKANGVTYPYHLATQLHDDMHSFSEKGVNEVVELMTRLIGRPSGAVYWLRQDLEKARKTLADVEKLDLNKKWDGDRDLEEARARHREVLKKINAAGGEQATQGPTQDDAPAFLRKDVYEDVANRVSDMWTTQKRFNVWHRTVGTQYHKAQKHAGFRRVFDGIQRFLRDTTQIALQSEAMAPDILPKMDTIRDLGRDLKRMAENRSFDSLKEADRQKLAEVIYTGTLDKQVWSEEDLLEKFDANDQQIRHYKQYLASINDSLDSLAKSEIVRLAKLAGMQKADDLMQMSISGAAASVETALNDGIRDQLMDYLEKTAKNNFYPNERFMEKARAESSAREIARAFMEDYEPLTEHVAAVAKIAMPLTATRKIVERSANLQSEGYVPLMRFGRYFIHMRDPETGETTFFSMFESESEANRMARDLAELNPEMELSQGITSQEQFKLMRGISPETLALFGDVTGIEQDEMLQQYYKLATNNGSTLRRLIHRKGTDGYSEDVTRALASFITSNARRASSNINQGDIDRAAMDIKEGDVKDEAIRLKEYVQNPVEEAGKLRGLMFAWFMGGSVASALVNITQPVMMTYPKLAEFGAARAAKELTAAMALAGKAAAGIKLNLKGDVGNALKRAEDEGIVAPQEIYQLMATASGAGAGSKALAHLSKLWGGFFSVSESFNRYTTFLAAYNLAKEAGRADAYEYAVNAVYDTQGLYNKGNRPNWARGAVGATLFTFKQFSIAYLEFLARLPSKQRTMALVLLMLAAGTDGIPFEDDLEDLIDALAAKLGYGWSTKAEKVKFLEDAIGHAGTNFVTRGISAFLPFDISGRMSSGNLIPGTGVLSPAKPDKLKEAVEPIGAVGGVLKSAASAYQGKYAEALPVAISNLYKGIEIARTGEIRNSAGKKVADAKPGDAVSKILGLNPNTAAEASRVQSVNFGALAVQKAKKQELMGAWVDAIVEKDGAGIAKARQAVADWNKKNPDMPILINPGSLSRAVQERRMTADQRQLKHAPREMRAHLVSLEDDDE
jgi:hypothetical protein